MTKPILQILILSSIALFATGARAEVANPMCAAHAYSNENDEYHYTPKTLYGEGQYFANRVIENAYQISRVNEYGGVDNLSWNENNIDFGMYGHISGEKLGQVLSKKLGAVVHVDKLNSCMNVEFWKTCDRDTVNAAHKFVQLVSMSIGNRYVECEFIMDLNPHGFEQGLTVSNNCQENGVLVPLRKNGPMQTDADWHTEPAPLFVSMEEMGLKSYGPNNPFPKATCYDADNTPYNCSPKSSSLLPHTDSLPEYRYPRTGH